MNNLNDLIGKLQKVDHDNTTHDYAGMLVAANAHAVRLDSVLSVPFMRDESGANADYVKEAADAATEACLHALERCYR